MGLMDDFHLSQDLLYDAWREAMLKACDKLPDRTCPFCGEVYDNDAEYVDVGVGKVQVTGNHCENPACRAWELGAYEYDPKALDYLAGWVRSKYPDQPSKPLSPLDFIDILEEVHGIDKQKFKQVLFDLYQEAKNQ